ncbi:PLP-dependent transferase [Sphingomonas sp. SM33]|uniref:PLP-dependent transferase n=1 Tax=Sphingomonas telluris TaxID=2907998 RepID=A0ABS9VM73_9SPHN|nr:PLP-dependent transferase [Sphingomonas telluris]MCH8616061.1 PLP-dependent transferase [Sphingomonas telluris]
MSKPKKPATIVAAAHPELDPAYGSVGPAIWPTDTFEWASPDDKPAFDYSRTVNPNRAMLVRTLAELEGAVGGVVTNSGQAAALLALLRLPTGARVVAPHDCYGGTYRLLEAIERQGKIRCSFVDLTNDEAFDAALQDQLALLWIETPSNPLMRITDIRRRASAGKGRGALTIADNTLASPLRQRPLDLGCDLVLHSTTKILNGHADLFGGALLASDPALVEELEWWSNAAGLNGSAFDSSQIVRGLRTLPLRLDRQEASAARIAEWLSQKPEVQAVYFPGLSSSKAAEIVALQQSGPGFMLSFELRGGKPSADRFVAALDLITLASSLGGFSTLICTPSTMTHRGMSPDAQREAGIAPDLLRMSVGLEDADDLIADLARGFSTLGS